MGDQIVLFTIPFPPLCELGHVGNNLVNGPIHFIYKQPYISTTGNRTKYSQFCTSFQSKSMTHTWRFSFLLMAVILTYLLSRITVFFVGSLQYHQASDGDDILCCLSTYNYSKSPTLIALLPIFRSLFQ